MSWKSIVNQQHVKDLFQGILTRDRLAHAYLFSGPEGVGKDALALEVAKAVNCDRSAAGEACDECPSCRRASALQHPNIHLIFALPVAKGEKDGDSPLAKLPEEEVRYIREQIQLKSQNPYHPISLSKANTIKINSVREIRKDVALMAHSRGKKVFIIIDAENMHDASSNALLKTLEEPPEDTLIILTTAHPDHLLPTISSRCQHIRFHPVAADDIEVALVEREALAVDEARLTARLADGSYGRALRLAHSDLRERRDRSVAFLRTILGKSRSEILGAIEGLVSELERSDVEEFFLLLQAWLRDALVLQQGIETNVATGTDESLTKFVSHYRSANLVGAIEEVERAISLLRKNVYIPLVLMTLAFKLQNTIAARSTGERASQLS